MPLRSTDPRQLGTYRLLRRLGEGGMGSVYLAESAGGSRVALKVIRADLAEEPEFRRRFRSEVARAQEVPPFCTAEVIDADPDHETPYLVVEYVDGPSLADVVVERGPLTPANLHGLAIGVATALTAIHGAGVIHRDLKPSNVLLAPGTPKVIDFGIARATEGSESETRTDQLMGTVAYMAPERLEPAVQRTLTPAADIFAWGAVITFAATGHAPFLGDTSPATAIAILTQKPNLEGVAEPLRHLVRRALAKRPEVRPTARQLLDDLLSSAPRRVLAGPAPLAKEALAGAAASAVAVTPNAGATTAGPAGGGGVAVGGEPNGVTADHNGVTVDAEQTVGATNGAGNASNGDARTAPASGPASGASTEGVDDESLDDALTSGLALAYVDITEDSEPVSPDRAAPTAPTVAAKTQSVDTAVLSPAPPATQPRAADAATEVRPSAPVFPAGGGVRTAERPRRSAWRAVGIGLLVLGVLASAGAVTGILTGVIKLPDSGGNPNAGGSHSATVSAPGTPIGSSGPPSASPSPSPSASQPPGVPVFPFVAIDDPLTTAQDWQPVTSVKYRASCAFGPSGYTIALQNLLGTNSYRCNGPQTTFKDFQLAVTVTLGTAKSCASIWFHYRESKTAGYALVICADGMTFGTHSGPVFTPIQTIPIVPSLTVNTPFRLAIVASGNTYTFLQCNLAATGCDQPQPLHGVDNFNPVLTVGVLTLGIFEWKSDVNTSKSYSVTFANIQVFTPTAPPSPSSSVVTPPAGEFSTPPSTPPSG
jgi:predicted Ser/Thr protein kinase